MKKLLSIITVLCICFSAAACGGTSVSDTVRSNTSNAAHVTSTESQKEVTGTVSSVEGEVIALALEDGTNTSFKVTNATVYSFEMGDLPSAGGQHGGTPPEMPQGGQTPSDGYAPPEKPSDNGPSGVTTPPEKPSGDQRPEGTPDPQGGQAHSDGSTPPEMPGGNMPGGPTERNNQQPGLETIKAGTKITAVLDTDSNAVSIKIRMDGKPDGEFSGGPGNSIPTSYSAANTYSENTSLSSQKITSTGKDENAVLVSDGEIYMDNITVDRISSDSTGGDNSSFYGVGAAVLTTGGSVNISNSKITTDAAGGAGVFSYGEGKAYVFDSTISTKQNCSGGIHVAGGGTLYASNLNVETNGESSAAIRSDRGSGIMVVDGGNYTSNGIGSPAIYSTAKISVNNANLTANGSEAICIEGKNSIHLFDCNLTGNMSDDSRNDCTWNVILYQSMSGDSEEGNSIFEMNGGTLTAKNGGMIYTTNTQSTFIISDVDIKYPDDCEFFLKCTGNSNERTWGKAGENGAKCSFSAIKQTMTGDVLWDNISTLDFFMTEGSTLTGAFIKEETSNATANGGYANLNISEDSTWVVTKNSTLTALTLSGKIIDENGKTVSVVGSDKTVYISGDSNLTVTVDKFSDTADLSACGVLSSFSDYTADLK